MSNLSVGVLVILLKHYFSFRTILVQRYVGVVLSLVQVVGWRHYPSHVVNKANTVVFQIYISIFNLIVIL